jgi:hypothetical protein
MLPPGPVWQAAPWSTTHPTKSPIELYYRNPMECIETLFNSPLLADNMELVPYRVYKTSKKIMWIYSEWMSGDAAWEMQVVLLLVVIQGLCL